MPIRFSIRFKFSGSRFKGPDRWRFAWMGLLLISGMAQAADELRVISLAPHLTELVYAAGAGERLVGVVDWSDYPPDAAELPSIGDAFRFDLERILGLEPDLALAWAGGTPPAVAERLTSLGIDVLWIETVRLDQIPTALETLGEALGTTEQGRAAATELRGQLARFQPDSDPNLSVFYQVSARPLYTLGGRHVINEVFARCGMRNLFADLEVEATVVDFEAVLTAQPDLIIIGAEPDDDQAATSWRQTGPVRAGRIRLVQLEPTLLIRPTPRIIEGLSTLCALK